LGGRRAAARAGQRDEQLAVGEQLGEPMREMHHQRCLADASLAGHHDDRAPGGELLTYRLERLAPTGEVRDVEGQMVWHLYANTKMQA
jgi:hypothetical protein